MDNNIRRDIILDNYQEPVNRGLIDDDSYQRINTNSESCIDNLDFMMKVEDDIVKDIRFDGEACAISTSATSIMIQTILGKSIDEVLYILNNYQKMIDESEYDSEVLGELNVYDEICKQPNRKNCALLPSEAIKKMIDELNDMKKSYDDFSYN